MVLSYTQSGKKNNLWEILLGWLLSTGRRVVNWYIFLNKNSFGFLSLPSQTYMHIVIYILHCFLWFLFMQKCLFLTCLSLQRPVSSTTGWHKYMWICVLLNGFTLGTLIAKFCCVSFSCTYLGTSVCPIVGYKQGPLPLGCKCKCLVENQ